MTTAKSFTVELNVVEDGHTTDATARLIVGDDKFAGAGKARRNPADPDMPKIGDELAIARALVALAQELGKKIDEGVGAYEGHEVHIRI